jgi:hypothetical protein
MMGQLRNGLNKSITNGAVAVTVIKGQGGVSSICPNEVNSNFFGVFHSGMEQQSADPVPLNKHSRSHSA